MVLPTFEYDKHGEFWFDVAKVDDTWFNIAHAGKEIRGQYWSMNGLRSPTEVAKLVLQHVSVVFSIDVLNETKKRLVEILAWADAKSHLTIRVRRSDITIYNWAHDNRDTTYIGTKAEQWDTVRQTILL